MSYVKEGHVRDSRFYAPLLTNLSTSSFPKMFVWPLTFQMGILWGDHLECKLSVSGEHTLKVIGSNIEREWSEALFQGNLCPSLLSVHPWLSNLIHIAHNM